MMLAFSLHDSVAEYYGNPIFARTRAEAIRSLAKAVGDGQSDLSQHAEHFALYEVGSFDPQSGVIAAHVAPVHVINAWELRSSLLKVVGDE